MVAAVDITLVAVLSIAAFFDVKERRIPNWLVGGGLATGLILNAGGYGPGIAMSTLGLLVAIGIFFVPFALGWMGAGDVKLFGVVGALLGAAVLPRVLFYSALAAGILALGAVLIGTAHKLSFRRLWLDLKVASLTLGRALPQSIASRSTGNQSVPWGVALAAGTIMAYYFDPYGNWAGF